MFIKEDCSVDKDIAARLHKSNRAYGTLQSRTWSQQGIRIKTKIKLYKSNVLPTLLYGSQTWMLYRRNVQIKILPSLSAPNTENSLIEKSDKHRSSAKS